MNTATPQTATQNNSATSMMDTANDMLLAPPEVLVLVEEKKAPEMVPLAVEKQQRIDEQVDRYVENLLEKDVNTEEFTKGVDSAFRLGREEISSAASLMTGRFMTQNSQGFEDSAAFKAMNEMRVLLDELNPGKQGDLLSAHKIFGLIPFGNKLKAYFRKFEATGNQLATIMTQLGAARDDMQRDAAEYEVTKSKLWEAMQKLKGAIYFAEQLDARLYEKVESLKAIDPLRAQALEQEVLFYARQNLQDMQVQMAVNVNGYLSLNTLKKTAREAINGCHRVETTGMSALATAQTVARATGNQIRLMETLTGINQVVGDLVVETSKQLGQHVERTADFAANPLLGIQKIQEAMEGTFKAMDAMDTFRSAAIENMGKNNVMLKQQIQKAEQYMERSKSAKFTEDLKSVSGPVDLVQMD